MPGWHGRRGGGTRIYDTRGGGYDLCAQVNHARLRGYVPPYKEEEYMLLCGPAVAGLGADDAETRASFRNGLLFGGLVVGAVLFLVR